MTRVSNPDLTSAAAIEQDRMAADVLDGMLKGPATPYVSSLTDRMTKQAQLPFRHGGLGLVSLQRTRHAAHLASFAAAVKTLEHLGGDHPTMRKLDTFFAETPCISPSVDTVPTVDHRTRPMTMEAIAEKLKSDLERGQPHGPIPRADGTAVPQRFEDVIATPSNLQHCITTKQHRADFSTLLHKGTTAQQAHLTSCAQAGASLPFQTIPTEKRMQVSNDEFAFKLTSYLDCPELAKYSVQQARRCKACGFRTDAISAAQHVHNCCVRGGLQRRHDIIRDTFQAMFRSGHLHTRIEVRAELPHSGQGGPDVVVHDFPNPGQTTLYDVALINPVQSQYLSKGATKGLVAADAKEKSKVDHHRKTAEAAGARIVPLIFETTGAFGRRSTETINTFAHHYTTKFGPTPPSDVAVYPATKPAVYWKQVLAMALVKGSYAMFRAISHMEGTSSNTARTVHFV